MSKLVECPHCIGTGEEIVKQKYAKKCKYCDGLGMVDKLIANAYVSQLLDNIDDE